MTMAINRKPTIRHILLPLFVKTLKIQQSPATIFIPSVTRSRGGGGCRGGGAALNKERTIYDKLHVI